VLNYVVRTFTETIIKHCATIWSIYVLHGSALT